MSEKEKVLPLLKGEGGGEVQGGGCTLCVERAKIQVLPSNKSLVSFNILLLVFFCGIGLLPISFQGTFINIMEVVLVGIIILTIEVIVGWSLVIGEYLYGLTDNTGQYHCHRSLPPCEGFPVGDTVRKATGMIARIRNGGWFKKSDFLYCDDRTLVPCPLWFIRSWNAKADLCFVDGCGNVVRDENTPLIGEFFFLKVMRFRTIFQVFDDCATARANVEDARSSADAANRQVGYLLGMRNNLVRFLLNILALIEYNRNKGKSKHAQEIRERIEAMIRNVGPLIMKEEGVFSQPLKEMLQRVLPALEAQQVLREQEALTRGAKKVGIPTPEPAPAETGASVGNP